MLKKLFLSSAALGLALAGAPAIAQTAPAAAAAPVATQDADPALWVVQDEDTTIYLFGTVHMLKPGLSWFDEAVKSAFDKSDTVVLELIEPPADEMQGILTRRAYNPSGPSVTEQLPEGKRAAYTAAMESVGMPPAMFDKFDPWFPAMVLTVASLPKYGYSPDSGAEKVITSAAKEAGKPIEALETADEQIGFFDGLSQPVQIAYLVSTVEDLPKTGEVLDKMVVSWAKGDPDALGAQMNESLRKSPEIAKALLSDRNGRWANWIVERMKKPGTVFIAVGAGHLAGPDSVQVFLGKKNLKVTRVAY